MNDTEDAARAVEAMDVQTSIDGAQALGDAFEAAGERIAASLESAARRGKLSFSDMAETVLKDLARLAVGELVEGPLQALASGITGALGSAKATNVTMNINGATDPAGFSKSQGQIGASLARAARSGARRIG